MNYLELVRMAWEEAGQSGDGPASVSGVSGHQKRFVNWVRRAWNDIQQETDEWVFRKTDKLVSLTAGQETFSAAALGFSDLQMPLSLFIMIDGQYSQLKFVISPSYTQNYLMQNKQPGRPGVCYFINGTFAFDCIPDQAYQLKVHYLKAPQMLGSNGDIPACDAVYHHAIVWGAVKSYARYDEDNALFIEASEEHSKAMISMHSKLTPRVQFARSSF